MPKKHGVNKYVGVKKNDLGVRVGNIIIVIFSFEKDWEIS